MNRIHTKSFIFIQYFHKIGLLFLLLFLGAFQLSAQNIVISGTVIGIEDELPLVGVNVIEKGTTNGTVTDLDGNYTLSIPKGSTVVFSMIGMENKEIVAEKEGVKYDVVLETDAISLDKVVVIGYSSQRKKDVTGAIAQVSEERLETRNLRGVEESIQGEIAGVQVTTPSKPGAGANIRIRGYTTFSIRGNEGANRPLILVDGQQVGQLEAIDPNDIAEVTVLKDASSAAIYGARAGNGVILIKTKKGKRGTQSITYNNYFGWQEATNQVEMLNAEQYVNLLNEAIDNRNSDELWKSEQNPSYNPNLLAHLYSDREVEYWQGKEGTNWQDAVLRRGFMQNHYLNYQGSSEKSTYSLSLGYYDQEGIYNGTFFERYNTRVNSEHNVSKRLKIGQNFSFNYSIQDEGGDFYISRTFMMPPTAPVYIEEDSFGFQPEDWENSDIDPSALEPGWYGFDPKDASSNIKKNPVAMADLIRWQNTRTHFFGNLYLDYELLEGLNFRSTGKVDRILVEKDYWEPTYSLGTYEQNAFADVIDFKDLTTAWENVLTFRRNIGGVHSVAATLGTWTQHHKNKFVGGKGFGFPSNEIQVLDQATSNLEVFGNATEYKFLSYFGSLNYAYNDKYLLTANLRRDGSSRFGPSNRWGNFPSFSLGWRLSNEDFLANSNLISDLKIRGGWGKLGNANI